MRKQTRENNPIKELESQSAYLMELSEREAKKVIGGVEQSVNVGDFFELSSSIPIPRGIPPIQYTFDVDANGILNKTHLDKSGIAIFDLGGYKV